MNNPTPYTEPTPLASDLPTEENSAQIVDKFDTATASHPTVRATMEQHSATPVVTSIAYTV